MTEKQAAPGELNQDSPRVTNLSASRVEAVESELVRMHQSAAQEITADEAALHQSAAFDVAAAEVTAHEAAMGVVTAREVEMTNSAAGAIRAENVNLTGQAGAVLAGSATLGNTYAGVVAGREIRGERIESIILLGNKVEGDIHTVVDTRGTILAGMIGGITVGILMLVGRLVLGRKS